jgi:hypothetical protein
MKFSFTRILVIIFVITLTVGITACSANEKGLIDIKRSPAGDEVNAFEIQDVITAAGNNNIYSLVFSGKIADHQLLLPSVKLDDGFILYSGDNKIAKYSLYGELLWEKDLYSTLNDDDGIYSIVACDDGGFILFCRRFTESRIIKFDNDVNVIWTTVFEEDNYPAVKKVFSVGNEVITMGYDENEGRICLAKLDNNGNVIISESNYNTNDDLFSAEYIPDVGIAVLFHATLVDSALADSAATYGGVAVFDFSLRLKWQKSFMEPLQLYVSENQIYIISVDLAENYLLHKVDCDGGTMFSKDLGNEHVEICGVLQNNLVLHEQGTLSIFNDDGMIVAQAPFSKPGYYTIINDLFETNGCFYILSTRYETPAEDLYAYTDNSARPLEMKERVCTSFDFAWNVLWEKVVEVAGSDDKGTL